MDPNGVFPLILRKGFDGTGWLKTLVESSRICNCFDSVIRTDLLMEASAVQEPGRVNDARPSEPRVPGCGFCNTTFPLESVTACNVQKDVSEEATAAHCGSFTLLN